MQNTSTERSKNKGKHFNGSISRTLNLAEEGQRFNKRRKQEVHCKFHSGKIELIATHEGGNISSGSNQGAAFPSCVLFRIQNVVGDSRLRRTRRDRKLRRFFRNSRDVASRRGLLIDNQDQ